MASKDILFRASATGNIMTSSREKDELSETTKTYLNEVFILKEYGIKKDIKSKYITKGLMVEEDSLRLYSEATGGFFLKNDEFFKNEYICGTPDIIEGDMVIDIKSSWDIFTFNKSKNSKIAKNYYWQLQSYMWLTGCTRAKLVYCLIDTPETLVNDEKRRLMWKLGLIDENEITDHAFEEIERSCNYSKIPQENRYFEIDVKRNENDIESLRLRVVECRDWMDKNLYKLKTETK